MPSYHSELVSSGDYVMKHNDRDVKELRRLLENLELDNKEAFSSIYQKICLVKGTVMEACVFVEQGNMLEAARTLAQLYSDCDNVNKHILDILGLTKSDEEGA